MLILTSYLASTALFYILLARSAPVIEESSFAFENLPTECEIIELFPDRLGQTASRAA